VCNLLVLLACVVSAGNAMVRYAFDTSSNSWLELQWYMFAVMVMFGASYTLKRNEHVRVEMLPPLDFQYQISSPTSGEHAAALWKRPQFFAWSSGVARHPGGHQSDGGREGGEGGGPAKN
jgi:hypothetical protein